MSTRTNTTPAPTTGAVVQVSGLRVELAGTGRVIAADVDFEISPGQILGLVGESGSGKTTVGTALLGFARKGAVITGGQVLVDGVDVLRRSPAQLQAMRGRTVSYVPQDPSASLNPALRIGTQLGELLEVHMPELPAAERAARVDQALADARLPTDPAFRRRFAHQLSGGQQQRVCLAMAFLLRPRAIVLDEPTTGLDVSTQAHVLDVVRQLCAEYQVAALYISHDLAVVAGLVQQVAVVADGHIVEQGECASVLRAPKHPYTAKLIAAVPDIDAHPPRASLAEPQPSPDAAAEPDEDAALRRALAGLQPGQPVVAVDRLSCGYAGSRVIDSVSLALPLGECLALVGESGSGKTTLSRAVIGLLAPTAGRITLAGRALAPTARSRPATARQAMQYVFQNPYASLNPRMTVGQTLARPYRHFFGGSGEDARRSVGEALDRVALSARLAGQYPDQLSGGERQRVAIARALVCNPQVLICDEVTSALDVSVQDQVLAILEKLKTDQRLSLLFVTHNLAVVRRLADRVAVLEHGTIVETGPTDDVLDRPRHAYTRALLADTPSWGAAPVSRVR